MAVSDPRLNQAREPDLEVVAVAGSLAAARDLLTRERTDVVLLDLRLADGPGFELLLEARGLPAPPAFIVVSSFGMPPYVDAALRYGASGFVLKTAPTTEILDAIRRVADEGVAFPAELLLAAQRSGWTPLSPRDRRLVALLLGGRTNDEIAGALGVTRKTIEAHLGRLFERFAVASRTELAVRAEGEGWLGLPPLNRVSRQ
jgi:two-component system response regulator DesR